VVFAAILKKFHPFFNEKGIHVLALNEAKVENSLKAAYDYFRVSTGM